MTRAPQHTIAPPTSGTVHVAACVVRDGKGRILLAQRRPDQLSGGYWEIPGGKIEPGETPETAAMREVFEETGLEATHLKWLCSQTHRFATGRVALDVFEATGWTGTPQGRENQSIAWVDPTDPQVGPILPSNRKALKILTLPDRVLCVPPPRANTASWAAAAQGAAVSARAGALMLAGCSLTRAQRISLSHRLSQKAPAHGLAVWQAEAATTRPQEAIVGLITTDPASLATNPPLRADVYIVLFGDGSAGTQAGTGALAHAVAAPVYAVVSSDPAAQDSALAAGATGLIIDDSAAFPARFQTPQTVALTC